jgi:hypothetical protein
LKADGVQRFTELIGQLCWAVEMGRVDILLETLLLLSYLAMPRVGHLEQALHMFGCLKQHLKGNWRLTRRILMSMRTVSRSAGVTRIESRPRAMISGTHRKALLGR